MTDTEVIVDRRPVYESVDELARDIGLSRALTYAGLNNGSIPCIRMGGRGSRIIIPRAAVEAWLASAGRGTVA